MNKNKLFIPLLKVMLLVLIAITAFEYAKYVIFPGLTVFYSHIIGIGSGVMIVGIAAYMVQKKQEKLLIEKIDETERRVQFEASLRNAEEKYCKLFIESMDGVCQTTLDGIIVEANQAFCDILGGDAGGIIGGSIARFYNNPEDRIKFRNVVEKNKGVKNYEIIQKRIDGQQIICSVSSSYCYSQKGEMDGYLTIVRDITDRKRAEELIIGEKNLSESIINSMPGIFYLFDAQGKFLRWNKNFEIVSGYSHKEILERHPSDFFAGKERALLQQRIRDTFIHGEATVEASFISKNGSVTPYFFTGVRIEINGQPHLMGMGVDIAERKRVEQEIGILGEIGKVIGSTLEIDEVYERFAVEAKKLIPFDRISVNLINPDRKSFTNVYVVGLDVPDRRPGTIVPIAGSVSEIFMKRQSGQIIHVESPEDLVRQFPGVTVSVVVRAGIRSMIGVPLISRDKVIGSLHFRTKKPNAYTENDLRLAERIGAQIAGTIANAQLFSDLKKAEKSLRESEGRFRGLVEQAAVGVAEIDMNTGQFLTVNRRLCELVGRTQEEMLATTFMAITHPEDLHLHEEKTQMMLVGEIGHYSLEKRYLRKDGGIVWANITVSPLWKPGEAAGRNIAVVEDITDRKRMEEEILAMSLRDHMTELYNRRGFITLAEQQIRAANRAKRAMLVTFIDCDGLKRINDTFGHEEGDRALIDTADVLRRTFRESDVIARLGGDEFAVLSINAAVMNLEDFSVRLQQHIAEFNTRASRPYKLAMSWGTAVYDPESPLSLDELMSAADERMYAQKKAKPNLSI